MATRNRQLIPCPRLVPEMQVGLSDCEPAPSLDAETVGIVAVVVTCNRERQLAHALQCCLDEEFDWVLVVNNGAPLHLGGLGLIGQRLAQRLHLLEFPDNLGGAGGFQKGLQAVYRAYGNGELPSASWCVLFDDDAYPQPGCLRTFRRNLNHYRGMDAVAAAVIEPSGVAAEVNRPILNVFRAPRRLGTVLAAGWPRHVRDWYHVPARLIEQSGNRCRVDAISFVGLFLSLEAMQRIGLPLPDPRLFIYSDDTLFTWGLTRRGAKLWLDSSLQFVHDTDTGYRDGLVRPIWKLFYVTRNSWAVYCSLAGWLLGPLLFLTGLGAKLMTCSRYPDRAQRRCARAALRLALVDLCRGRAERTLQSLTSNLS